MKRKSKKNYQSSSFFLLIPHLLFVCLDIEIPKECKLKMNILFSVDLQHCIKSWAWARRRAFYLDWNENGTKENITWILFHFRLFQIDKVCKQFFLHSVAAAICQFFRSFTHSSERKNTVHPTHTHEIYKIKCEKRGGKKMKKIENQNSEKHYIKSPSIFLIHFSSFFFSVFNTKRL